MRSKRISHSIEMRPSHSLAEPIEGVTKDQRMGNNIEKGGSILGEVVIRKLGKVHKEQPNEGASLLDLSNR